jgi:hypothetical protein
MVKCMGFTLCFFPLLVVAQEMTFYELKKLPPSINSDAEEIFPLLSPDGKTLYFARFFSTENTGGKFSGADVWKSEFDVTTMEWGKPTNGEYLFNDKGNNAVVGIGGKGDVLYMLNTGESKKIKGIYFSKKMGSQWTKPELIPIPGIVSDGFLGAYVSPDFDVIILSMEKPGGRGEEDLYFSLKDEIGEWTFPKSLGSTINTAGFEISPFLSSDKKRLYFSSNGHQGLGDADIFYSERLYDSWEIWSSPKNLGEGVNSSNFDAGFTITDNSISFFCSNRDSKLAEVYTSKVTISKGPLLPKLRALSADELEGVLGKNRTFNK